MSNSKYSRPQHNELLNSQEKNSSIKGAISNWNAEKGFGFITLENRKRIFCHVSELCSHLRPCRGENLAIGTKVIIGKIQSSEKGETAKKVVCEECAKPEKWELKAVGKIAKGVQGEVQELIPVSSKGNSSFSSPISQKEIEIANAKYLQAKKEEETWKGLINETFIKIFGEAKEIEIFQDENLQNFSYDKTMIRLKFDYGIKTLSANEMFDGAYYKFSETQDVIVEKKENSTNTTLYITYICDKFPQLKLNRYIASIYENSAPTIYNDLFEKIPKSIQEKIINILKQHSISPKEYAKKLFDNLTNQSFFKKQIQELRDDIFYLKHASGDAYIARQSYKTTEYYPESDDERRPAGELEVKKVKTTIHLGGIKNTKAPSWAEDLPYGVKHSIRIEHLYENNLDIEALKEKLIKHFEESYQEAMKSHIENAVNSVNFNPVLNDKSYEEYIQEFKEEYEKLLKSLEEEWELESEKKAEEYNSYYKKHQETVEKLERIENEINQALEDAEKQLKSSYAFNYELENIKRRPYISSYFLEEKQLLDYENKLKEYLEIIRSLLKKKIQEEKTEAERQQRELDEKELQKKIRKEQIAEERRKAENQRQTEEEIYYLPQTHSDIKQTTNDDHNKPESNNGDSFVSIFELTQKEEKRSTKEVKEVKEVKEAKKVYEIELLGEELRKKIQEELFQLKILIEVISSLRNPDKKDPNYSKVSKLKAKIKELKGEIISFENELSGISDANKARGKNLEFDRRTQTISKEYAKLTNSNENFIQSFKEYMEKTWDLIRTQELEICIESLRKITIELINLAQEKEEFEDIDSRIEEIIIMNF